MPRTWQATNSLVRHEHLPGIQLPTYPHSTRSQSETEDGTFSGLHGTKDDAYFVFGDLPVNTPRRFRLKFLLYKRPDDEEIWLGETMPSFFKAYKHLACLRTFDRSELTTWLIT